MAAIINTNIQSLTAQRNLSTSQNSLSTSMQRLSSGLRINSAKDDAAGMAISERMTTQIRGLNQAGRNANDGISLAQTAEGALGTIGNNLQRIRELAVQSRNATNSTEDRAALQKEVAQLKQEIDRVADQTSFNGTQLIDGSFTDQAFQVGANQGQIITISGIADANIDKLGAWNEPSTYAAAAAGTAAITDPTLAASMSINGVAIGTVANPAGDAISAAAALQAAFAAAKLTNGALANVTMTAGVITSTDPKLAVGSLSNVGGVTAQTTLGIETKGTGQTGFTDLDISTVDGADKAILAMDGALKAVNSARADLGAIQNRFEAVVSNLAVNSENLSASRSRIMDADFAAETANLSRSQILQQAGTAMVAQANQLPQNVLKLLQ